MAPVEQIDTIGPQHGGADLEAPPGLWLQAPPGLEQLDGSDDQADAVQSILNLVAKELGKRTWQQPPSPEVSCDGDAKESFFSCPVAADTLWSDSGSLTNMSQFNCYSLEAELGSYDSLHSSPVYAPSTPTMSANAYPFDHPFSDSTSASSLDEPRKVSTMNMSNWQSWSKSMSHDDWEGDYALAKPASGRGQEQGTALAGGTPCRWHESAKYVGTVSADGHVFTKAAGAERLRSTTSGAYHKLSSICMIYDDRLRCGGMHSYNYHLLTGEVGAADGAGFVFDCKVRRSNLQRMRSIFLNNRGQICFRNKEHVQKLNAALPRLEVGMSLNLMADLENLYFHFTLYSQDGVVLGMAEVSLGSILGSLWQGTERWSDFGKYWQSGFFCAIVTKDISVSLE